MGVSAPSGVNDVVNSIVALHVYVIGGTAEAVFELHCPDGPVTLRESCAFKRRALRPLMKELDAQLSWLCSEWERIHDANRS